MPQQMDFRRVAAEIALFRARNFAESAKAFSTREKEHGLSGLPSLPERAR
jgi:hypothetical protein